MEWFSQKTSIVGVQIPNWIILVGTISSNLDHLQDSSFSNGLPGFAATKKAPGKKGRG